MAKRKAVFSNVNIVPYLDVMLVLLVIFMATTPIVQMGVNLDLPQGKASPMQAESPVILSIDKKGMRYLQVGDSNPKRITNKSNIENWLKDHKISTTRAIQLQADKSLPWQKVLTVLLEVNQLGWKRISLMTEDSQD